MPPAEMQRLFGLAVDSANQSYSVLRRRHEHVPAPLANPLDDVLETGDNL